MQPSVHESALELRRALMDGGPQAGHRAAATAATAAIAGVAPRDREAWLDVLWDVQDLPEDDRNLPRGCVPYLPCPVETVLEALTVAEVSADDVFVDLGSGLGRTAALVHLVTGAGCLGLEIQPALHQGARARARGLGLERLRFIEGDAAELVPFLTVGSVFFLYCPFGGHRLQSVLSSLEELARLRPIRICCVGMPAIEREWLDAVPGTSADLAVYRSVVHRTATRTDRS